MPKTPLTCPAIAYLCVRLSPYHFAQLKETSKNTEVIVMEFSSKDPVYSWDVIKDAGNLHRVTLFDDKSITRQSIKVVAIRVRSVLNDLRPRVVAISGWDATASLLALQWCLNTNIPTILMSDSQEQDEPRVWWKEFVKGRIVRLSSAGFVGGAPHITYLNSLGMAKEKIVPGSNIVDNDYFEGGAKAARQNADFVRHKRSLPEHYFLVSSRFIQKKNLLTALRAYAKYRITAGDGAWKLVLLGDGPLKEDILRLRKELDLAEMVLMPGFKQYDELPVYYGLAGAFVLASTSEQWGLVVNEAMASGLPVIVSSRCGCVPDLVWNGKNGFVFEPDDIQSLADCLTKIAINTPLREVMGAESRRIISSWNLDLFARNLCKAAYIAMNAPHKKVGFFDKLLLSALIHRPRQSR